MTCKLLPKWQNFAKSGHTVYTKLTNGNRFEDDAEKRIGS